MKRRIITFAICSTLLLVGCNANTSKKADHFKEYNFKQEATELQKDELFEGVKKSVDNLCAVEATMESYERDAYAEYSAKMTMSAKFYEDATLPDNYILGGKMTYETYTKKDGISYKEIRSEEGFRWDTGKGYFISSLACKDDGETFDDIEVEAIPEGKTAKEFKQGQMGEVLDMPEGDVYVTNEGNYAVVSSNISRDSENVVVGTETREAYRLTRSQAVYNFSKDYKLLSGYIYIDVKTNRDTATGEWYKSEQLLGYEYISYKYSYGKKANKTIESLNASLKNKPVIVEMNVIGNVADVLYNNETKTYSFEENPLDTFTMDVNPFDRNKNVLTFNVSEYLNYYNAVNFELEVVTLNDKFEVVNNKYQFDYTAVNDKVTTIAKDGKKFLVEGEGNSMNYTLRVQFDGTTAKVTKFAKN